MASVLFESLSYHLPSSRVQIDVGDVRECAIEDLPRTLFDVALRHADDQGRLRAQISVLVSRQALGVTITAIAQEVAKSHAVGIIHGDLKPTNVLLCTDGPALIDAFALPEGDPSPGWTPNWSAPEQVLGEPTRLASDIYPLGIMLVKLMKGRLVGEVRKFRTPPIPDERDEDVFYNPSIFIDQEDAVASLEGIPAWRTFAASCLRFDPARRPSTAGEFETRLQALLIEHPFSGEVSISLPGELRIATLPDGTQVVGTICDVGPPVSSSLTRSPLPRVE